MSIRDLVSRLIDAGVDPCEAAEIVTLAAMEGARSAGEPTRTPRQERNSRYYESKRLKASEKRLNKTDQDVSDALPPSLSEGFPLSPEPPISNPKPIPPTPPIVPPAPKSAAAYPEAFDEAWRAYPHAKGRSSKPKTMAEWRRLPTATRDLLPGAAARYGREGNEPRADCGAPAFERWIRDARFVDWLPGPDPPTVAVTPEILARRMRHFEETGEWREPWGPRPQKDRAA